MPLCLNMIVKNESKIIIRLLESVINIIDYYYICDTGSTDNTVQLINDFFINMNGKQINGIVDSIEFINFEQSRNTSLQRAIEYTQRMELRGIQFLLLDADMILHVNDIDQFQTITGTMKAQSIRTIKNGFSMIQYNKSTFYKNIRIISASAFMNGYKYHGWTHEYIPNNGFTLIPKNIVYISDIEDGGSKEHKYARDIQLLERYISTNNDNNNRSYYYLGRSYFQVHEYTKAIEYLSRVTGSYKWHSMYTIGLCHLNSGHINTKESIKCFKQCSDICSNRIENLYQLYKMTNDLKYYYIALDIIINYNEEHYIHYDHVQHNLYRNDFIEEVLLSQHSSLKSVWKEFILINIIRRFDSCPRLVSVRNLINNKIKIHQLKKNKNTKDKSKSTKYHFCIINQCGKDISIVVSYNDGNGNGNGNGKYSKVYEHNLNDKDLLKYVSLHQVCGK